MYIPTHLPTGDTSNQLRMDDGQGDLRSGVLRLVGFAFCVLFTGFFCWGATQADGTFGRLGWLGVALVPAACGVSICVVSLRRLLRRRRSGPQPQLFHNRAARGRE